MSRVQNRLGGLLNVLHEMLGGVLRGHAGVYESDQVRDRVIAKDQVHLRLVALEAMDGVQLLGQSARQVTMAVASERNSQAAA